MKTLTNSRSKGAAGARNTGIFIARGSWICQIDSDDQWPSDMLQRFADALATAPADVGIVYGSLAHVDLATGKVIGTTIASKAGHIGKEFLEDPFFHHCSAALSTSLVREIGGYDEAFRSKMDTDLLIRMTERCAVLPVPDVVYTYFVGRDDQLVRKTTEYLLSYEQLMHKHASRLAKVPKARYRLLSNILLIAAGHKDVRRVARTWFKFLPSVWRSPRLFLRTHRKLGRLSLQMTKGLFRRVLRRVSA